MLRCFLSKLHNADKQIIYLYFLSTLQKLGLLNVSYILSWITVYDILALEQYYVTSRIVICGVVLIGVLPSSIMHIDKNIWESCDLIP